MIKIKTNFKFGPKNKSKNYQFSTIKKISSLFDFNSLRFKGTGFELNNILW